MNAKITVYLSTNENESPLRRLRYFFPLSLSENELTCPIEELAEPRNTHPMFHDRPEADKAEDLYQRQLTWDSIEA